MSIYYSAKENAFYDANINEYIPVDAVEISAEHHSKLLTDQSKGFVIQADENGYPIAHAIKYSQTELDARKKAENIAFLSSETRRVNDAIAPLDDAIEFGVATEDEIHKHTGLRKYRLLLSRVPNQETWPLNPVWPDCPEFFKQ